jgi:hypothetical protein
MDTPKIFGFAEFISALALLVIIYTLVDVRYRFRIAIAPSPLYPLTFAVIGVIGAETLISEVWLAQGWWLPKASFLTYALWQGIFGTLFLTTFLTWAWYAFIHPPIYGRRNYDNFAQELYRYIVKGDADDLVVIADELRRSAKSLVEFAPSIPRRYEMPGEKTQPLELSKPQGYANDILRLIANRKFCRHIAASSPATAISIFMAAADVKKWNLSLGTFAKNITVEAIGNPDSLLFHESDEYSSGLIGNIQPFSKSIYGNYALVEGLAERFGSPLDVLYEDHTDWDASQWKAYCRVVLTTIGAYLSQTPGTQHSYSIYRALSTIKSSFHDTPMLNGATSNYYSTDTFGRLSTAVKFVREAAKEIDKQAEPPSTWKLRLRDGDRATDMYDWLATLMFDIVLAAAGVSGPQDTAWTVQHNTVWGEFFGLDTNRSMKILQFKLSRLLYDEIVTMDKYAHFQNTKALGFCLNVMGLNIRKGSVDRGYHALHKSILAFAVRSLPKVFEENPRVAEAVLVGSITYDAAQRSLVKTYLQGTRAEAPKEYLQLAPRTASLPST